MHELLTLVIAIIVLGLVCWLVLVIIDMIPMPDPFKMVAKALMLLVMVLYLVSRVLPMAGLPSL